MGHSLGLMMLKYIENMILFLFTNDLYLILNIKYIN